MIQFFTATRAMGRLIWALVTRRPVFVTPEEANERLGTCETECQHFETVDRKCLICRCYVDLKSIFATEDCPKRRWKRRSLLTAFQ